MDENEKKAVAYSLLAHIRNSGTLVTGPLDYFIPLVKRALNSLNNRGNRGGKSLLEIHDEINNMFSLEIPIPVLVQILKKIEQEENVGGTEYFKLYNDNSYLLKDYHFYEYEHLFQEKSNQIDDHISPTIANNPLELIYVVCLEYHSAVNFVPPN